MNWLKNFDRHLVNVRHLAKLIRCKPATLRKAIHRGALVPDFFLVSERWCAGDEIPLFLRSRREEIERFIKGRPTPQ